MKTELKCTFKQRYTFDVEKCLWWLVRCRKQQINGPLSILSLRTQHTHTHTHMRLVMRKQWRVTRHVCARRTSNNDVPECDWATLACVRACVLCSIHDCIRIALKSSILTLFEMHVCAFFRVKSIVVGACARCGSGRYCLGINCSWFFSCLPSHSHCVRWNYEQSNAVCISP